jgi:hypothetical protein
MVIYMKKTLDRINRIYGMSENDSLRLPSSCLDPVDPVNPVYLFLVQLREHVLIQSLLFH